MQETLLQLLDHASQEVGLEYDPMLTRECVHAAEREYRGAWSEWWSHRVAQAGKKIGLRISPTQEQLNVIKPVLRNERLVITYLPGDTPDTGEWIMVAGRRGSKVLVFSRDAQQPKSITHRALAQKLSARANGQPVSWMLVERLLPCEEVSTHYEWHPRTGSDESHGDGHGHGHLEISPFGRLLLLMRPERHDLWIIVFYAIGVGVLSLATPLAIEALVTTVALNQILQQLITLSMILLLCLALAAMLRAMQIHIVEMLQRRVFARLASDLAHRLPRVKIDFYDSHYGPEMVNRFFEVLTIQKVGASLLLDGISVVLAAFFGMLILAFYHPFLLGFDLVLILTLGILIFFLGRGAVRNAIEESKAKYSLVGELQELARSPQAYKVDGAAEFASLRTDACMRRYLHFREHHWTILFRQIVFALVLQAVATAALLGLGGWLVIHEDLNLGQLVAAELIVATILAGFAKMGKHLESWYDLMAAMDKVGHLMDMPLERNDGERLADEESVGPVGLTVKHLTYGYEHQKPILEDVHLEVKAGERVALIGPSGSGKSTLADLVFGLREPDHGTILIGDQNARDVELECLRRQVAYVVQRLEILEASILENVRVGRTEISLRQVRRALDAVALLEEIDRLPDGLATRMSTNGDPLSTGQAQRLMLARAIVAEPRLLILDEALDGLEFLTRQRVVQTVLAPNAPWTLILVTHEQDIAQHCDRAVALSNGRTDRSVDMGNGHSPRLEDWLKEVQTWRTN